MRRKNYIPYLEKIKFDQDGYYKWYKNGQNFEKEYKLDKNEIIVN